MPARRNRSSSAEVVEVLPQSTVRETEGDVTLDREPGGAEVISLFGDGERPQADPNDRGAFDENLAERMTPSQRRQVAALLIEFERVDLDSRKNWEAMSKRGMTLLGVDKIDAETLPFPGAAAVQHPLVAEAVVQFQSNAIEEFFPATGPVKGLVIGLSTPEKEDQRERCEDFLNYYLTAEDEDYYADSDQMLFRLPIDGSIFRKVSLDPTDGMPRARYVSCDDFIVPYGAKSLREASRYCHRYTLMGTEIRRAVITGEFADLVIPRPSTETDDSKYSPEDKADRMQEVRHEDDEVYTILEYHADLYLPGDIDDRVSTKEIIPPYVFVVDKKNEELLSCRRNWKQSDPDMKKRLWFAHYKFLPGIGFYGWGFVHMIGSLAEGLSGAVRALLDASLAATMSGGFKAKDGIKKGGSISMEFGKWKDVDATHEELQKTFYTPPFKEPSNALFNLAGLLATDGRRFVSMTEVLTGNASNKAPVGTTIALIEQSMKLFTAIHKRIFSAARQEFRMLAELIGEFGPYKDYPYEVEGASQQVMRSDFDSRVDFLPVADPNIISSVQRIAMAQATLEVVTSSPDIYGAAQKIEAHKRFLRALKVPQAELIEPKAPTQTRMDPISENALAMMGKGIRAYPGQNHQLHNAAHRNQVEIARNTLPADQFEQIYQILMSHVREHEAQDMLEKVSAQMQQRVGAPMPPIDINAEEREDMPPELENALTMISAQFLPPVPEAMEGSAGAAQPDPVEADIANKQKLAEADIARKNVGAAAERQRKESASAAEQRRKDEEFAAEQRRKDEAAAADILRANAQHRVQSELQKAQGSLKVGQAIRHENTMERARKDREKKTKPKAKAKPKAKK